MNENVIESIRIKHGKKFRIAWIAIISILIVCLIISFVGYIKYMKGQELAVELTEAVAPSFGDTASEMYGHYNVSPHTYNYNGYKWNNSEVVQSARAADRALGDFLTEAGYPCNYGSDYLEHGNFWEYTFDDTTTFTLALSIAFVISVPLAIINLLYASSQKKMLVIEDDKIICKKGKKVAKEFFIRDVKTVELAKLKGLKILGNSIKYKIALVKNAEDIKNYIMDRIPVSTPAPAATPANQDFTAENLMKFKELLDQGVITEEEFEAKKKQLLRL